MLFIAILPVDKHVCTGAFVGVLSKSQCRQGCETARPVESHQDAQRCRPDFPHLEQQDFVQPEKCCDRRCPGSPVLNLDSWVLLQISSHR